MNISNDLEGKVAVVTGAAKGIGFAAAEALKAQGARIVIADIDDEGERSARSLDAIFIQLDVSSSTETSRLGPQAVDAAGRIDILVNSAGIQRYGNVVDTAPEDWDLVLAVNLKSMYLTAKSCIPHILEAGGGTIVNVASVQGFAAQRGVAAYSASKGGAIALTRAIAIDFAPQIRANCVCPGSVDTPMLREAAQLFSDDPDKAVESWGKMHPMGRVAHPQEVGDAIAYLAGPRSSFITGAALLVDGGLISVIGGT